VYAVCLKLSGKVHFSLPVLCMALAANSIDYECIVVCCDWPSWSICIAWSLVCWAWAVA